MSRTNDLILGMFLSKMHREQMEVERMKIQAAHITEAEAATLAGLREGKLVAMPREAPDSIAFAAMKAWDDAHKGGTRMWPDMMKVLYAAILAAAQDRTP